MYRVLSQSPGVLPITKLAGIKPKQIASMKSNEPQENKDPEPEDSHFAQSPESPPDPIAPSIPLQPNDIKSILDFQIEDQDDFGGSVDAQEVARIYKPGKTTWFQTHPDDNLWRTFYAYKPDGDDGVYVVSQPMVPRFGDLAVRTKLVPWIDLENVVGFWPLNRGPSADTNGWLTSAMAIAVEARGQWRRLVSNRKAQLYTSKHPIKPESPPVWPSEADITRLMEASFADRVITDAEHPAFKKFQMS